MTALTIDFTDRDPITGWEGIMSNHKHHNLAVEEARQKMQAAYLDYDQAVEREVDYETRNRLYRAATELEAAYCKLWQAWQAEQDQRLADTQDHCKCVLPDHHCKFCRPSTVSLDEVL